jgi:large subunit ribosomal protein L21
MILMLPLGEVKTHVECQIRRFYKKRRCLEMYAVIETGGKQYRVQKGDVISVEKLGLIAGEGYTFDKVLMVSAEDGIKVGNPYVEGATVVASTIEEGRGKKVVIYKYKSKKGYHKKTGHRQYYTKLMIDAINA